MSYYNTFLLILLFGILPIFLWGVAIYYGFKLIGLFATAGVLYTRVQKEKKTNFHYYDRDDMYFDYYQGQWIYKSGFPKLQEAL
jgi:hypothetical protein